MVKYYSTQILAAFLVLGSFKFGMLAYAEYGRWVGWATFVILIVLGIVLDRVADKIRKPQR